MRAAHASPAMARSGDWRATRAPEAARTSASVASPSFGSWAAAGRMATPHASPSVTSWRKSKRICPAAAPAVPPPMVTYESDAASTWCTSIFVAVELHSSPSAAAFSPATALSTAARGTTATI